MYKIMIHIGKAGLTICALCVLLLLSGCAVSSDREYYLIKTESELKAIGETYPLDGNYKLDCDLTLTEEWEPIGNREKPFTGVFDGNGYTIYHLTGTEESGCTGFFGATVGATLKNVILEDSQIGTRRLFPISYYCINTEIINCSINAGSQKENAEDAARQAVLGYDEKVAIIEELLSSDYRNMQVAEFNTLLLDTVKDTDTLFTVMEDLADNYSSDSEEYLFVKYTLPASYAEIMANSNAGTYEGSLAKERTTGRSLMDMIEFGCHVTYQCSYEIMSDAVTVSERDRVLQEFDAEMQDYLEQESEEFLQGGNAKQKISEKMRETAEGLSTEDIRFTAQLNQILLLDENGEYRPSS